MAFAAVRHAVRDTAAKHPEECGKHIKKHPQGFIATRKSIGEISQRMFYSKTAELSQHGSGVFATGQKKSAV